MASLLELVAATVKLTRRGHSHWCPCPFHAPDKTGSFSVRAYSDKERFYCFGCGARGDAVDWLMLTRRIGYFEAKRLLGEKCAKPDPAILAAREAAQRRREAMTVYRDRNPDCSLPDWAVAT